MASGVNFFCSYPVTVKWATKCQLSAMHFLVFTAEEDLCDFVDIVSSHVCRWRPQAYYGLQKMSFADEHKNVCPH